MGGNENIGSWPTGAEMGRDAKEKRRKKRQKEGERGKQNKQREVMERDWARKAQESREKKGGEERKGGGGGGRQISYLRENPHGAGLQKTPRPGHSSLLLPPDHPLPLCLPGPAPLVSLRSVYF